MPVIPHFSNECLEMINVENIKWPNYDVSFLKNQKVKIVIQINGKKRGLIELKPNVSEEDLLQKILKDHTLNKYLINNKIKRKIYIKDKLFNVII